MDYVGRRAASASQSFDTNAERGRDVVAAGFPEQSGSQKYVQPAVDEGPRRVPVGGRSDAQQRRTARHLSVHQYKLSGHERYQRAAHQQMEYQGRSYL